MKKLFLFFAAICVTVGMWAGNIITYTATSQLEETFDQNGGLYTRGFNLPIQSHTFANGTGTITFSGDVTTIKPYAFYGCPELTSITLPNSIQQIGTNAFANCTRLTSFTAPESLTSMAEDALQGCTAIITVNWNASDLQIANGANSPLYTLRNQIRNIYFGDNLETIPARLCWSLNKLSSVTIPASVKKIGDFAFEYSSITSVVIGEGVEDIGENAFDACHSLSSVQFLGNSLRTIGDGCFAGCIFTTISLPASLQQVGQYAFYDCTWITELRCYAMTPPVAWDNSFESIYLGINFYIPRGTVDAYTTAPGWRHFKLIYAWLPALAVESVEAQQPGIKTIENGQVVIIRGDKKFNLMGAEL